ncbi:MAG: hypothetical protein M1833_007230 [Piccolia ochrophora]|nr:MAG: hypothetical protein M1833_007230 [Piccolia ochrophora]
MGAPWSKGLKMRDSRLMPPSRSNVLESSLSPSSVGSRDEDGNPRSILLSEIDPGQLMIGDWTGPFLPGMKPFSPSDTRSMSSRRGDSTIVQSFETDDEDEGAPQFYVGTPPDTEAPRRWPRHGLTSTTNSQWPSRTQYRNENWMDTEASTDPSDNSLRDRTNDEDAVREVGEAGRDITSKTRPKQTRVSSATDEDN